LLDKKTSTFFLTNNFAGTIPSAARNCNSVSRK